MNSCNGLTDGLGTLAQLSRVQSRSLSAKTLTGETVQGGLAMPDNIASVAFWFQADPHVPFPKLPDRHALEII